MASITTDDGVRLDYTESGDPTGRPVVLIAGFRAAASSWLFQVPALEKAGYRVIAFDRRWHGRSEKPAHGNTMQRHGADLNELLEQLDLRDAVLVGGSMGGNTIWAAVDQAGTSRVAGIVIVDQTPRMRNGDDWPHGFYGYDDSNADTHFATGVPPTGRPGLASKGPVRILRLLRAIGAEKPKPARDLAPEELAAMGDHARADWRRTVARADVPVLFVAGAESELWPPSHAAAAAELAPRGRSVIIPRAGHPANLEQPKAFTAILLDFLATLPI